MICRKCKRIIGLQNSISNAALYYDNREHGYAHAIKHKMRAHNKSFIFIYEDSDLWQL